MLDKLGEAGLVTAGKVIDAMRSGVAKSYVDYTRPTRVEPRMIVDSSVMFYENTAVVTQSLHSAFSAYYLLAWNIMQAGIDNIAVARHLDKLNPNRSIRDSALDSAGAIWMMSNEGYRHKLPSFGGVPSLESKGGRGGTVVNTTSYLEEIAQTAARDAAESVAKSVRQHQEQIDNRNHMQSIIDKGAENDRRKEAEERQQKIITKAIGDSAAGLKKDLAREHRMDAAERNLMEPGGLAARSTEVIKEASNLSVGKILEVQISNSGEKRVIPIMVRLMASIMTPDLLKELLSTGHVDNSVSSRWVKYQSGQINLIDLLTARDLVKQHKRNLMKDTTGVYTATAAQNRTNKFAALLSMNPSVANSTNLVVTTTETIKKVELAIGGRFDNFKTRQALFDATGLFIVAVIDQEYDRVKFYTTDIPEASDLSIRECKAANQKEGASITDMMKAYQLGNAPSF